MKWLSRFLCPTELDRTRAAEAGARTRMARTLCAGAMGAALVLVAPWQGWWTLGLFALVAVNLATLEWRMRRSHYPEVHAAASQLFVLLVIGAGVAIDGGPSQPGALVARDPGRDRGHPLPPRGDGGGRGPDRARAVRGDGARRPRRRWRTTRAR